MKKTPLKSKSKLKTKKGLVKSGKLKAGKKTKEWETVRRELKEKFLSLQIESCELKFDGCTGNWATAFAHSKKRRNIQEDEIYEVALLCQACHYFVEGLPEAEMTRIIREVISKREQK